jgi:hypothetical protein
MAQKNPSQNYPNALNIFISQLMNNAYDRDETPLCSCLKEYIDLPEGRFDPMSLVRL